MTYSLEVNPETAKPFPSTLTSHQSCNQTCKTHTQINKNCLKQKKNPINQKHHSCIYTWKKKYCKRKKKRKGYCTYGIKRQRRKRDSVGWGSWIKTRQGTDQDFGKWSWGCAAAKSFPFLRLTRHFSGSGLFFFCPVYR